MREEAYLGFRWTRRTIRTAFLGVLVFPGILYWTAYKTNRQWNWAGKGKEQSLDRATKETESQA